MLAAYAAPSHADGARRGNTTAASCSAAHAAALHELARADADWWKQGNIPAIITAL